MPRQVITPDQRIRLAERYLAGESVMHIAQSEGLHDRTVRSALVKASVRMRPRKPLCSVGFRLSMAKARISLAPREAQILEMLLRGATLKEIAGDTGLSYASVASVKRSISCKLGLGSDIQLGIFCAQHGLVGLEIERRIA